MIAAVKDWHVYVLVLLFLMAPAAPAAEDLNAAARELARKTAALAGPGETVSATWTNRSSLDAAELARARSAFEAALKDAGARLSEVVPTLALHVTVSENQSQYLLVEEARRGDDRQVWISGWNRGEPALHAPRITLEKSLVWEQEEQILDIAFPTGAMLVLSPSGLSLYTGQNGNWQRQQAAAITPPRPWPRDLRGRLHLNGSAFQATLPGMVCSGAVAPSLTMDCHPSDEPWALDSGAHAMLLANFLPARNYFDGRVTTQTGVRKTLPPFYAAASVEEDRRATWLLTMLDGGAQLFDAALEPLGFLPGWGSDIVGTQAHCGSGSQVLATRPGDAADGDAVQAFTIVDRAAAPLSQPVTFAGAVTALWPSTAISAVAVAAEPAKYAAYVLTVSCNAN